METLTEKMPSDVTAMPPPVDAPTLLPSASDFVILVMGLVGSGKSTFINALIPQGSTRKMTVKDDTLSAVTTEVDFVIIDDMNNLPNGFRRLVLVDTPGFDNPDLPNSTIYQKVADWSKECIPGNRLGGIIFLHDTTTERPLRAIEYEIMKRLCRSFKVAVTMTKWKYYTGDWASYQSQLEKEWKEASPGLSTPFDTFHVDAEGNQDAKARGIVTAFLSQFDLETAGVDFGTVLGMREKPKLKEVADKKKKEGFLKGVLKHFGEVFKRLFGFGKRK